MTKIYTAKELADISDDPATIEAALGVITSEAHAAAITGERCFSFPIGRFDHSYTPIIKRLGELGYKVDIFPAGQIGKSNVCISW
ncbi:hypothetical protein [Rothia nasimurium]|uniref:hypothetical protein n=1 Tax=Rothia nasimurium TaxID=85336 RepID=UPI001F48BA55|nr:hypothetical protein [Rothia nasimurium]